MLLPPVAGGTKAPRAGDVTGVPNEATSVKRPGAKPAAMPLSKKAAPWTHWVPGDISIWLRAAEDAGDEESKGDDGAMGGGVGAVAIGLVTVLAVIGGKA